MMQDYIITSLQESQEILNFLNNFNDSSNQTTLLIAKDELYLNLMAKFLVVKLENGEFNPNSLVYKKVMGESSVDVFYYPKEKNLAVEHSNEIVENIFLTPLDFKNKYYIIKNIENATPQAQNKLLKCLEEPPHHAKFILLSTNEGGVINTIKSRSQKVVLPNLSNAVFEKLATNEEFLTEYKGVLEPQITLARELSQNTFGEFFNLLNNNKLLDVLDTALSVLTNFKSSGELLEYSSKISALKTNLNIFFNIFNILLHDLISLKTNNENLVYLKSTKNKLENLVNNYSLNALSKQIGLILNVQKKLNYNVSSAGVIDNFLLEFMEVKLSCK